MGRKKGADKTVNGARAGKQEEKAGKPNAGARSATTAKDAIIWTCPDMIGTSRAASKNTAVLAAG